MGRWLVNCYDSLCVRCPSHSQPSKSKPIGSLYPLHFVVSLAEFGPNVSVRETTKWRAGCEQVACRMSDLPICGLVDLGKAHLANFPSLDFSFALQLQWAYGLLAMHLVLALTTNLEVNRSLATDISRTCKGLQW